MSKTNSVQKNYASKFLGQDVLVKIDRPLGSRHPKYDMTYEVNYGFIPETLAPDGEEVDAYVLGLSKPVANFKGRCIALIHRLDDKDDKLIVTASDEDFTDDEIKKLTDFQERYFKSVIVRN
ncbi:inorganic diphosphatase [Patescibacteria group bacterium]